LLWSRKRNGRCDASLLGGTRDDGEHEREYDAR
jgi:hypothetical protein